MAATPLTDSVSFDRRPLRTPDPMPSGARVILLLTEDDLAPETWQLKGVTVCGVALHRPESTGPNLSPPVRAFKTAAFADAHERAAAVWAVPVVPVHASDDLVTFAKSCGAECALTAMAPVGYLKPNVDDLVTAAAVAGVAVRQLHRPWDALFWPHAKAGFFQLKERIPAVLRALELAPEGTLL